MWIRTALMIRTILRVRKMWMRRMAMKRTENKLRG
jgi:hypothetical protein